MVKSFNEWPNTNMKKMKITYREFEQAIKLLQSPDKEINSLGIELLRFYNISVFHAICSDSLFMVILDSKSMIHIYRNTISGKIMDEKIEDLQMFYVKWMKKNISEIILHEKNLTQL